MTTGGPDTADVYELKLKEDDPTKYLYDGQWRTLTQREITIEVKESGPKKITIWSSHHGPIVAMRKGKAYVARMAYTDEVQVSEAWYEFNTAKVGLMYQSGRAIVLIQIIITTKRKNSSANESSNLPGGCQRTWSSISSPVRFSPRHLDSIRVIDDTERPSPGQGLSITDFLDKVMERRMCFPLLADFA
jgi:hypothetical protein